MEDKKEPSVAKAEKDKGSPVLSSFKLNAHAPEFVPRAQPQTTPPPISGCYYYTPWFQFVGDGASGVGGGEWFYFPEQDLAHLVADSPRRTPKYSGNTSDALQRIVRQVEYQFSDANLVSSDYMMKLINKDPEGYVPIAALVSQKKVKSLGSNSFMLAKSLRTSSKLVVSEDGKRVRRKQVFSERDKEDLQARTVIVENLPEESSRQNIEKIFSTVGRVRSVRICYPQDQNSARHSKSDVLISNKLHALVEYETAELADKAAEKLNDERNWRKGLRVRVMLRRSPRSVMRNKREDYDFFDDVSDEDDRSPTGQFDSPRSLKLSSEHNSGENPGGLRRSWSLVRGKSYGGLQGHNGYGVLSPTPQGNSLARNDLSGKHSTRKPGIVDGSRGILSPPQPANVVHNEVTRQPLRGPRMPDGTRGFTMGRGRPLASVQSCPQMET